MRATDILRQLAHTEGFDPRVVSKRALRERLARLVPDERRDVLAEVRRSGKLMAPGVFVVAHPLAAVVYQGLEIAPRPVDVAAALEQQHGWVVGVPRDVALYVMGMGERPLSPSVLPYDQSERRQYACGLTLEPSDPAMLARHPAAQAVLLALAGRDLSAEGIERLVATAAAGAVIASPLLRECLAEVLAKGELYGAAEAFAQALLAAEQGGYATRAPADWQPPADPDAEVRVDGWQVAEIEDRGGRYHALISSAIHGHPYISNGDRPTRSSPILWIDEMQGWCRTQSRLYRLGMTVKQYEQHLEERRRQAEAERQQAVAGIKEIRALAEKLGVGAGVDWAWMEAAAGRSYCGTVELRDALTACIESGRLGAAASALAADLRGQVEWLLNNRLEADF